jgi:chromosome segregation ATPase
MFLVEVATNAADRGVDAGVAAIIGAVISAIVTVLGLWFGHRQITSRQRSETVADSKSIAVKELEAAITHLSERNASLEALTDTLTKREHDCEVAISELRDECQTQRIHDAATISELRMEIGALKAAVAALKPSA